MMYLENINRNPVETDLAR